MSNWTRRIVVVLAGLSLTATLGVGTALASGTGGTGSSPTSTVWCC